MGKTIEKIAINRGHTISLIIDNKEQWEKKYHLLKEADIAIDFSTPEVVIDNINRCFDNNIPIIVGTTAWQNKIAEIKNHCLLNNKSLLWASNFSIGVNIFFKINRELAKLMNQYQEYDPIIEETHHTAKLDAPSGTAISLAKDIIQEIDRKDSWKLNKSNSSNQLVIESKRIDPIPGTHKIIYNSDIDNIEIVHRAKNRNGFAMGAVIAAEWLQNKTGFYEFKEVFF